MSARARTRQLAPMLFLLLTGASALAQKGVTTLGLQLKPVLPLVFFDPLTTMNREHLTGEVELTGGLAFGMNVRIGLSDLFSLETGLGQITRRFDFRIVNDTNGYSDGSQVRLVGYELPLAGLVYIRLGEYLWMNTALGGSFDFYASDVQQDVLEGRVYLFRRNWAQMAVLGNLGVEYRTPKSGIIYLGATYHRTFAPVALAELTYYGTNFFPYRMQADVQGTYLTLDLRYYFHEDPERRSNRRKK